LVAGTQTSLDIQRGPLFAVDLFNVRGDDQRIFLAAHHLCVDLVSWRIILQDLQEFLETGSLTAEKPLPFQTWCAIQADQSQQQSSNDLPFNVMPADLAYWGMEGDRNTYRDAECESFVVDEALTALAMGDCHKALQTEPLDLLLSTIIHSFSRIFVDRANPTVYNESHGRENPDHDLSRTVGWFTTICPLHVSVDLRKFALPNSVRFGLSRYIVSFETPANPFLGGKARDDVLDTLRRTKDTRHRIPENGRPYFANRFLAPKGRSKSGDSGIPMEMVFNYLGRMQQLERTDSLLQQVNFANSHPDAEIMGDMGPDTARFALFEISAVIVEGKLQFSFMYNRHVRRARDVSIWIAECKRTLEETVKRLAQSPREPTLCDYPLMPMTYDGLKKLVKETFPEIGVKQCDQVEDVYPCSPLQEGVLISQLRDPAAYLSHVVYEARHSRLGIALDAQKIADAWQKVVNRHAALRTVFIDSVYRGGVFDQVVVKNVDSGVILIECADANVTGRLESISLRETNYKKQPQLPHQLTVCTTSSGRIFIKAEINHAVIDGSSLPVLLRDLTAAYENRLDDGNAPLYSDYIRYIRSQAAGADLRFWKTYLGGVQPSHFPQLNHNSSTEKRLSSVKMEFDKFPELRELCERTKVTFANVMHTAWALVLRSYTGSDDVCFGYLTSGRDAPINGIQEVIGVFINMLCCRVKIAPTSTLAEVFHTVQDEYFESLPYQRCSLAQVQHDLGLTGKTLYNTSLSIQNHSRPNDAAEETILFEPTSAHDPTEVS
jgi:non-ribosomal peptide synthase protein (TIGR01720 family)